MNRKTKIKQSLLLIQAAERRLERACMHLYKEPEAEPFEQVLAKLQFEEKRLREMYGRM